MYTSQHPLASGFGAASTAAEVLRGHDLTGQTAIVTGGYAGIGLETARTLQAAGAHVIVPARDPAKAAAALADLPGVELETLDLLDPASIDAFAGRFRASGRPLHLLINNAGIMATPLTRDARGYEAQFATNHLGHFQLTARLWPALQQAQRARVVALSSRGHRFSPMVLDDPNFERRPYDRWTAYGQSKTANILFALALNARTQGQGVQAYSVHPGSILSTDLSRNLTLDDLRGFGVLDEHNQPVLNPARQYKTIAQGAATTVWCATSPLLDGRGGTYCENCDVAPVVPADAASDWQLPGTGQFGVAPYAIDSATADQLWMLSEQLTGVTFPD